ncbi:MAG: PAS domain-containing protein [Pseudomonadales bacterium]|nr:PAS domain-containing protein [Pseudomonadales bacterium]
MLAPEPQPGLYHTGSAFWRYLAVSSAILVFLTDTLTPLGLAHGVLYTLPVILSALALDGKFTQLLTLICSLLILLAVSLAPAAVPAAPMAIVLINRSVSILAIVGLAILITIALRLLAQNRKDREQIQLSLQQLEQREGLLSMASELGHLGGWALQLPAPGKLRLGQQIATLIWSPEMARIHGLEPSHTPTLFETFRLFSAESASTLHTALRACATKAIPFDLELQLKPVNRELIWVRVIGQPVVNTEGMVSEIQGMLQDLSAEKAQEQQLHESNKRFQQLADALPIIVWTALPDGTLDYVNQALADYTGITTEALLPAQRWLSAIAPQDRDYCITRWQQASAAETDYEAELGLLTHEGKTRWHLVQAKPVRNDEGQVIRWYGIAIDIHDRKLLEERTRDLAERHQNTLESISDGLYVLDQEWRFTYINQQAEKILQRNRHQLLGRVFWNCFPQTEELKAKFESAIASQTQHDFQFFYKPLSIWLQIHAYPSAKGLTVYLYDISADVALQKTLAESEERFRIVAKTTTDSVWDWDARTGSLWWNDGFYSLFGFQHEQVENSADFWASRIHPEDRRKVVKSILSAIRGNAQEWQEEYRFLRQDDSIAWVIDRGSIIRDEQGKALRMVGGMTDITQRKQMENQLQQSERLRAIGELTGGVAHDFNNMLTVIIGNAENLSKKLTDPRDRELAEMICQAATRSAQLTQRLLAFARQQPLQPEHIDIKQMLNSMEVLLRRTLPAGISLEFVHGGGLWHALADPGQLENILLNLCLNARDAMQDKGRLTIESANTHLDEQYCQQHTEIKPGQYVMLAVSDTGCGIPATDIDRVFEPFFTTKRKGHGAGLGLSMVYGFIKQSSGHIKVYSEPGQGTTIKIYLPRSLGKPQSSPERISNPVRGGYEKILLVEDDAMVRQYAQAMLLDLGYQVLTTDNAEDALNLLQTHSDTALLFTDIILSGEKNGRELADIACSQHPDLKVLYTSGYTENAIVHQGRLDPGIELLSKPFRRQELAARIRKLLD